MESQIWGHAKGTCISHFTSKTAQFCTPLLLQYILYNDMIIICCCRRLKSGQKSTRPRQSRQKSCGIIWVALKSSCTAYFSASISSWGEARRMELAVRYIEREQEGLGLFLDNRSRVQSWRGEDQEEEDLVQFPFPHQLHPLDAALPLTALPFHHPPGTSQRVFAMFTRSWRLNLEIEDFC